MSPLPCPAAVRTSGTATIACGPPAPGATSRATASATDGRASSMNPPSTAGTRPCMRARTCPTNRVNSATPASLRVPWPTRSKGGPVLIYLPPSRDVVPEARQKAGRLVVPEARQIAARGVGSSAPGHRTGAWGCVVPEARPLALCSVRPGACGGCFSSSSSKRVAVEQGVEGGRGDCGAALLADVGDRGQPAVPQRLFHFDGPHKTHRQADDQSQCEPPREQIGQGGGRGADHPYRAGTYLAAGHPDARRRAGDAEHPGKRRGLRIRHPAY